MLKLPSIAVTAGALLIAGCGGGGGGGGGEASGPLDAALRYIPADAPFVAAIDTDTDGEQYAAADRILDRFPFGDRVRRQLTESLDSQAGGLERLERVLGNEFVVGSTDATSFIDLPGGEDTRFVAAIQAPSEGALADVIEDEGVEEDGEASGATIYKDDDGDPFAVEGDVLVVAGSRKELQAALERRDGDESMTEEAFDAGTGGVPADGLARVYLDVRALLRSSDEARDALKAEWVRALRTAGIALAFEGDEVAIDLSLETDPADLTAADLPIATGGDAPQLLDRDGDVRVALRNPAHVLDFARATAKAVDPQGFGAFELALAQIERSQDVDVEDDLLAQLEGDLAVTVNLGGGFGARAELEDPARFERTLAKLADVLPELARGIAGEEVGFAEPKAGEDFYAIATADGDKIVFGVVDGVFVLANDPQIAGSLAADRTRALPGGRGALVVGTDAEQVVVAILDEIEGLGFDLDDAFRRPRARQPLDELNGSFEVSTERLTGRLRLTLDE
jgi:hypothetical protein